MHRSSKEKKKTLIVLLWKRHVNCVGGIQERGGRYDHEDFQGRPKNYINQGRFLVELNENRQRASMRPRRSVLWPWVKLVRVVKWGKTTMFQCLEWALYQCWESRERNIKAEGFHWRTAQAPLCVHLSYQKMKVISAFVLIISKRFEIWKALI